MMHRTEHRRQGPVCALLAALTLMTAAGCGSLGSRETYRAQSPGMGGMGGMPRPPRPSDEPIEPTLIEKFFNRISDSFKPDPNAEKARQLYADADRAFEKKEYRQARKLYEQAAALAPTSLIEENALFMIGECHFFRDDYSRATDAYQLLMKRYSNTRHMDLVTSRLYSVGTYWRDQQQRRGTYSVTPNVTDKTRPWFDTGGHALRVYESVWLNDPTGSLADDAIMQTANTHFAEKDWIAADQFYTQLRNDFPNSRHVVQAFVLGYRAKLNAYNGPGYEAAPLLEAEQLIETLRTQFASQLGDQATLVKKAYEEVRAQKAEREWYLGEVFYRQGNNRAAAYYYQRVKAEFGDTRFRELADDQLKKIADEPPIPPKRLAWLIDLLPGNKEIPKPIDWKGEE